MQWVKADFAFDCLAVNSYHQALICCSAETYNIPSLHNVINRDLQAQSVSSSRLQIIYGCCELEPSGLSAVADPGH